MPEAKHRSDINWYAFKGLPEPVDYVARHAGRVPRHRGPMLVRPTPYYHAKHRAEVKYA